jgi:hypothetical protein
VSSRTDEIRYQQLKNEIDSLIQKIKITGEFAMHDFKQFMGKHGKKYVTRLERR